MNGTYGFAYSANFGIGFGVLLIEDGKVTGYDSGGSKYEGTAATEGGSVVLTFDMIVPPNSFLTPMSSDPMGVESRWAQKITLPPGFDGGGSFLAELTFGKVHLLIKKLPDTAAPYASGFVMYPAHDGGGAVALL